MTEFEQEMIKIQKERNQILKDAFVVGYGTLSAPEKIAMELMRLNDIQSDIKTVLEQAFDTDFSSLLEPISDRLSESNENFENMSDELNRISRILKDGI